MLTIRYMPNTNSVLHLHPTLVPFGFCTIPIYITPLEFFIYLVFSRNPHCGMLIHKLL